MAVNVKISSDRLEEFCRKHRIRKLALFGSALHDDFTEGSDVDILVEFEPDARVGLNFFRMQSELSEILGRKVDLNTPGFISRDFRNEVQNEAEVLYDASER